MPLKETHKSLRLYFGVIAAFSAYHTVTAFTQSSIAPLETVLSVVDLLFGALFAYIAVTFSELLHTKPSFIKRILVANLIISVIGFPLTLPPGGLQPSHIVGLLLAVLITVYLVKSVTRLSGEMVSTTAQR